MINASFGNGRPQNRAGRGMARHSIAGATAAVAGGFLVALLANSSWGAPPAKSAAPNADANAASKIVALVNNEEISREQLAAECLQHYGREVLDGMIHRHLIIEECRRQNITITSAEVDAEIERMATRFGLPVEQWLKMLKQERGIKPAQYATDIVWPMLALRRLAGARMQVSPEELTREYETQYGAAVRARMIVCDTLADAQQVHKAVLAKPENFGNLAKDFSRDPASASLKGLMQPIRPHVGHPEIERLAYSMHDDQISEPVKVGPQYVILKREKLLPAMEVKFEDARPRLEEIVRDRKQRSVAGDVFQELRKHGQIEEIFGDPARSQQMPNVAAIINGRELSMGELAVACIERHGEDVLDGCINRRLLEQACRRAKVAVSEKDLQDEIARAASLNLRPKADGSPDVENWLKMVTQQQGIPLEIYRRDAVWPSVALKKLVADRVIVTDDDLRKGFEANYGPRVRCRAIVLTNARLAQRVWDMARKNLTVENFGELAAQYSVEATSRALQGEVPPIRKHGGQPLLEKEAFALQPGELSGIIQSGDKFIILLCEGVTQPVQVNPDAVRALLAEDIRDKKIRVAMGEFFEQLKEGATIDNVLAGTSHSPGAKPDSARAATPDAPTTR